MASRSRGADHYVAQNNLYVAIIIISGFVAVNFILSSVFSVSMWNYFVILATANITVFCVMLFDKAQAYKEKWRVRSDYLAGLCLLSAGIVPYIASKMFRHKTWQESFALFNFAALGIHIIGLIIYYKLIS